MNSTIQSNMHLKNIVINQILTSLSISRSAFLYIRENESLSIKGLAKGHTAVTNLNSAVRAVYLLKDMLPENNKSNSCMSYCSTESFFTAMTNELNTLFASGTDVSFRYASKLEKGRSFYIDIKRTEAILFSLIHCLVKTLNETDKKEINISVDEKLSKDKSYIITLSAKGRPLEKRLSDIFSRNDNASIAFYDLDTLSLLNVCENVEILSGKISYSSTKTTNKFMFTFPHSTEFDTVYNETVKYKPDTDLMMAYFCDLLMGQ